MKHFNDEKRLNVERLASDEDASELDICNIYAQAATPSWMK
jgi:hypothetical protein